ncbi:MAG: hypothetical protein RIC55_01450 [Pirellulaceae bacterium]
MDFAVLFSKVVGPVLLVRALSIVIDRKHFYAMMAGVEKEITTVAFSFFPIALMMSCIAIEVTFSDTSSLAAWLIHLTAWGGMAKAAALMLFPRLVVAKVKLLAETGFLYVVLLSTLCVGAYFVWFGYFARSV